MNATAVTGKAIFTTGASSRQAESTVCHPSGDVVLDEIVLRPSVRAI